jgi:hypothetical protein
MDAAGIVAGELQAGCRPSTLPDAGHAIMELGDIEMPFSFQVDESTGVVHIQSIGEVNDAEVMELSERLRHEVAFVVGYPILCDCSKLTAGLISSSLIESLARAARSRTNFVAIIAPRPAAFGLARMFQIFSDPEDSRTYVFTEREEAMAWLETRVAGLVHQLPHRTRSYGRRSLPLVKRGAA